MAKKNDAWGIELGADAIKAVRLTRTPTVWTWSITM